MGVYLVTWQLNPEKPDHDEASAALVARLEEYQYITVEEFERVYFVSTPLAAGQINADLHKWLESGDMIVVAQVMEGSYCGYMPQQVWDWIEERL
jgi:hypothetical protein